MYKGTCIRVINMYVYYTRTYMFYKTLVKTNEVDFPGGPVVRSLPASAGDTGSIPGPEDLLYQGAPKPVHHRK